MAPTRPVDTLEKFEAALHAKMEQQLKDMDAKDVDGKPTWDAKARNDFYKIATEYVIKKRQATTTPLGGKLGGD